MSNAKMIKGIKRTGRRLQKNILDLCCRVQPDPLIVLGNQKSGTTAIAALIAKATRQSVTLDFFFREPRSVRKIVEGQSSLRDFIEANRAYFSKEIIKDPDLTFIYPQLREIYPNSKTVFILRDPVSNVKSILNRLGLPGKLEVLSDEKRGELDETLPEWFDVMDGSRFGHRDANPVIALLRRAILSHEMCCRYQDDFFVVRYEDFLTDKKGYIERLCAKLGIPVSRDISDHVDVQYQPKGKSSVDLVEFFGHENMQKIRELLEQPAVVSCLERNGYSRCCTDE